jgi:hypothetical protein
MQTVTPGEQVKENDQPFHVLPGYQVERLFVVPRDELGSWVSLATDPRGRLYASDQQGQGLVRITPAAHDGSTETVVEKVPAAITGAQGMLWAFDCLYVVCNGGTGSGLYRLTDSDGDDRLDAVEKLRTFSGGGEHGPHNILLSPDGTRLFIICGNHTDPPFGVKNVTEPQTMAGIRPNQRRVELAADGTSRLPANWDEDMIIRRMWDGNGHATGKPGTGRPGSTMPPVAVNWVGGAAPPSGRLPFLTAYRRQLTSGPARRSGRALATARRFQPSISRPSSSATGPSARCTRFT